MANKINPPTAFRMKWQRAGGNKLPYRRCSQDLCKGAIVVQKCTAIGTAARE